MALAPRLNTAGSRSIASLFAVTWADQRRGADARARRVVTLRRGAFAARRAGARRFAGLLAELRFAAVRRVVRRRDFAPVRLLVEVCFMGRAPSPRSQLGLARTCRRRGWLTSRSSSRSTQ